MRGAEATNKGCVQTFALVHDRSPWPVNAPTGRTLERPLEERVLSFLSAHSPRSLEA